MFGPIEGAVRVADVLGGRRSRTDAAVATRVLDSSTHPSAVATANAMNSRPRWFALGPGGGWSPSRRGRGAPCAPTTWAKRVAAAKRFAEHGAGADLVRGRRRGLASCTARTPTAVHNSASVVKVLFMVALLREPGVRHDDLTRRSEALLEPMIQRFDNGAATAVFNRVGEAALYRLADDVGLDTSPPSPPGA